MVEIISELNLHSASKHGSAWGEAIHPASAQKSDQPAWAKAVGRDWPQMSTRNRNMPSINGERIRRVAERHGITQNREHQTFGASFGPGCLRRERQRRTNVQAVAARCGFNPSERLEALERTAVHVPAEEAARKGENLQAVAQRHGVTLPQSLHLLEKMEIGTAEAAGRNGESVQAVAARQGIVLKAHLERLKRAAAP